MLSVKISLKTAANASASKFEMTVGQVETVQSVKEKVAASQLIAFPEYHLELCGQRLDDGKTMQDYGVSSLSTLDFMLEATEKSVVEQLTVLLKSRDLTCDELGLLYCYKHGVSTNQALKTVGLDVKLADFVKDQKEFVVEGKKVSLVRKDTSLQPLSVAQQLEGILKEHGTMEVPQLCSKFIQKFHVGVGSIVEMRPLDFLRQESDRFTVLSDGRVALKGAEPKTEPKTSKPPVAPWAPAARARSRSPGSKDLAAARASTPGSKARSRSPGTKHESRRAVLTGATEHEAMYQELHGKVSSRSFNSRIAQALNGLKEVLETKLPLNIAEVAKGGSVAKGTAITGCEDAELVLFLDGLPEEGHGKWLPPLLRTTQGIINECCQDEVLRTELTDSAVRVHCKSQLTVDVKISPVFRDYNAVVQSLGKLGPNARKPFEASFTKERTQFVARQPGNVKVTIRLLKWWRDQQAFSCALTTPSDYLVELVAVYAYQQCGKLTQAQMVANCMQIFAKFDQLRVMWSNFYEQRDVWAPLLMQRPLLMDPVNPFTNIADPQDFDPRELTSFAAKTHFFW